MSEELAGYFNGRGEKLEEEAEAITGAEDKYVYSLIGVAGAIIGFAMYRSTELTMTIKDILYFVGVLSAVLGISAGYLNRSYHIAMLKAEFWSGAMKLTMEAEAITSAGNPHLEDAKKRLAEFIQKHIEAPGNRALAAEQFWFNAQPLLIFFGAVCIFLWMARLKFA